MHVGTLYRSFKIELFRAYEKKAVEAGYLNRVLSDSELDSLSNDELTSVNLSLSLLLKVL